MTIAKCMLVACVLLLTTGIGMADQTPMTSMVANRPCIELEGHYWFTDPKLTAKFKEGISGVDVNAVFKLNSEAYPVGRINWYPGRNHSFRLEYTPIRADFSRTFSGSLAFDDISLSASGSVRADLSIDYVRMGWVWQFLNCADDKIKFGTLVELKGTDIDASFRTGSNNQLAKRGREAVLVGYPAIGVALDLYPHRMVNLFGEIDGIIVGNLGKTIEWEAGIRFRPTQYMSVVAAYRWLHLEWAWTNDRDLRLDVKGPYVGLSVGF